MPPTVSVIVPAFNAARTLEETLESVRSQTVEDWECLVCDDGSSDDSAMIARHFATRDRRIIALSQPNSGTPGPPRNHAISKSKGRFLAFLDADDRWHPEKLRRQLDVLSAIPKPGICYTYAEEFTEGTNATPRYFPRTPPPPDREAQFRWIALTANKACISSVMITREFFDQCGGAFMGERELAGYEDWDLVLRSLRHRPLICVPELLTQYRIHPGSMTSQTAREWKRRFRFYERMEQLGDMPRELRGPATSVAWLVRGEAELATLEPGWRLSMLRAFGYDPINPRRWPCLAAGVLPGRAMRGFYGWLKAAAGA